MNTTDEIRRRVEEADTARSSKRAAAAQQVGELAQRRATLVKQVEDIERQLADLLAASSDVIDVPELAQFTDVSAADLTRWLNGRKTGRAKRKRAFADTPLPRTEVSHRASAKRTSTSVPTSPPPLPRADTIVDTRASAVQ